jgi:pimeloyl-ACP methyl ester carboxylesterase
MWPLGLMMRAVDSTTHTTSLPCLVFIPGTLCDGRIFKKQVQALRGVARCITLDYAQLKDLPQWQTRWLARLPQRFYLAGFSLGGLMALEFLRAAPERIEGLALIASNAQPAGAQARRRSAMLRHMWLDRGPSEVARHVKPAYFHHEAKRRKHQQLVFDMATQTPKRSAFEEFAWAAQRPSGLPVLRDFNGKLLAISGAQDRLCPRAWQRAMCEAQPRMQWREIARCGHFVPLEAPAKLSHALQAWLGVEKAVWSA